MDTQIHILTEDQARRLGVPELTGQAVTVVLYAPNEQPESLKGVKMAKHVYSHSRRIGGMLHLEE